MTLTLRKLVLPFCLLGIMWMRTAHAAPPNDPVSNLFVTGGFNGLTNGQVNAAVLAGTPPILYIGGDFSAVRPYSGHGVVLDADPTHIGTADATFPQVDGDVFAVVPDGAGGWYIAGAFTGVGGVPQRNVAHIIVNGSDKTVDTAWRPDPTGLIRALALSHDGKTLYIGGDFEGFGPTKEPPLRLAAIGADPSKPAEYGKPTSWDPEANGNVRALAISNDDSLLYVGGDFFDQVKVPGDTPQISIGGQIRNHLAAVLTTGPNAGKATTTWNPNVDGRVQTLGLAKNGNVLYVGGNFHNVGTPPQLRDNIAAVQTSGTGALKAWNPAANKQVLTLTVQGKRIYAGGKFTQIGGAARNFVAALDKQTGLAVPTWDANPASSVQAIVVAGPTVYLGGNFAAVNGPIQSGVLRNNIAAVRKSDGVALLSWNPNCNGPAGKDDGTVLALALNPLNSTQLYAGGTFDSAGDAVARNNLAAFDATTGALRADIDPHPDGPVYALAAFGNTVYAAGDFPSFQGGAVVLQRLASINAATGQLVSTWHPDADGAVRALAVSPDGNIVYAGGEFSIIASVARARLGAISAASGGPWPGGFNPGVDGPVLALATLGTDKLYVGGTFSTIANTGRTNLALIKSAGGTNPGVIQSWDPQPNGAVHTILLGGTTACTPAAAPTVYIGGAFTTLNSGVLQRNHLAALKTTGTPVQICNWNPGADGAVRALALSGDTLFIGGDFTAAGTVSPRCRLAAVDVATGIAKSVIPTLGGWNPGVNTALNKAINPPPVVCPANSNSVRAMAESDSVGKLYVGGLFSRIQGSASTQLDPPGLPRNNLAAFSFATLDSVISPLTSTTHTGTLVNGILVTVTNQAPITAQQVSLAPKTLIPGNPAFNFISWNPTTGFGTYNTPVDIPPFPGQQVFFIAFDPLPVIDPPVEVQFTVEGTNTTAAGSVTGVNTLFLGATDPSIPTANIPALAQDSNGVPVAAVQFPTTTTTCTGQTSFIVAARNTGETEAILVTPKGTGGVDDSDPGGNVKLTICLLDGNGQCVANPPAGANIPLTFTGGTSAAFKVTVAGAKNASIPNDPNNNRIKVEFRNTAQKPALRGLASVAVSTFGSCQ